jgi:hypothetical protein
MTFAKGSTLNHLLPKHMPTNTTEIYSAIEVLPKVKKIMGEVMVGRELPSP